MKGKKRSELFRDTKNGKIAGVCAGIADFFGWESWLVRIFFASAVLLGSGFVFVAYIAAWFILDKKQDHQSNKMRHAGDERVASEYQQHNKVDESIKVKSRIWQAGEPPRQALHDIRRRFKRLENKLIVMERYVTSSEFTVSREINKL